MGVPKAILNFFVKVIASIGYLIINVLILSLSLLRGVLYNLQVGILAAFSNLLSLLKKSSKKSKTAKKAKKQKESKKIKKSKSVVSLLSIRLKEESISFIGFISSIKNYLVKKIRKFWIFFVTFISRLKTTNKKKLVKEKKAKRGRPKKEVPIGPKLIKKISRLKYFILGVLFGLIFITVPLEVYLWFRELPKAELLVVEGNKKPTRILDRNGKLLYEIYVDKKYDPVTLDQIPSYVINATIAVEDAEFYNHPGIRLDRMIKAAQKTIFEGEKQGASTITQQLIKNVLLTPERTVSRKIKEIVLSFFVEAKYTKDQILELYLNNISYGGVAWGIQAASEKYFGKNVWELDLAEASMLAGLPSSPSTFSPLTDLTLAKQRQLYVLNRMNELGYITKTELLNAYNEELIFADQTDYIRAPHFVQYIRKELENIYGKRTVDYGGLTVITTLDLDLQERMETIVKEEVAKDAYLNLTNGAAVVLDVNDSSILGYVGSVDYFKDGWGAFDVASAYRQPGSSIKPITYALALEKGYTPASIIEDKKVTYSFAGSTPYVPVNYDGRYHGSVTLRTALANSYNIPAVKLANDVSSDAIVSLGNRMGLKNWKVDGSYGLSVTLGGKEVRLLDHANVYATFAREGSYKDLTSLISIKDSRGYELYKDTRSSIPVLSREVSYLIWDILSDNNARTPAFGPNSSLVIPGYTVAVKTGTTDNKRDNWTMGFTPDYVIGVWVGNNDNTPMNQYLSSGLTGASPIWNRLTQEVLSGKSNNIFAMPDNVFKKFDKDCNRSEVFIKGSNVPQSLCPPKEDKTEGDKDKDN